MGGHDVLPSPCSRFLGGDVSPLSPAGFTPLSIRSDFGKKSQNSVTIVKFVTVQWHVTGAPVWAERRVVQT